MELNNRPEATKEEKSNKQKRKRKCATKPTNDLPRMCSLAWLVLNQDLHLRINLR